MSEQSEKKDLIVLFAPVGVLSGDGQLRESFRERRARLGADYPMWYLSAELIKDFNLPIPFNPKHEAVVAEDPSSIAWLKLRFGGNRITETFEIDKLKQLANQMPEAPERRDIGIKG
tara:strand:+ start:1955 stop:2305 length:351 start_codon:yes stop_codon:yes gene_type:complete